MIGRRTAPSAVMRRVMMAFVGDGAGEEGGSRAEEGDWWE
eukprot:CAMPEP_0201944144 /NCGR_PEP_ID=MMETSP0903-20130614/52568_1 /ASSEMBLY_ACC=CAM_ASM_000552 /TAXON_ID=420261 /ORGANISM="Thalassiosira antarctica, Strain CCMP982" /LENGTH=39 /DNA_ID= /DNA_START= /DNA_END= /DNA_ORIENTATION=